MNSEQTAAQALDGIGVEDLPAINRALFNHAINAARNLHHPHRHPEAFIEALWQQLAAAFDWHPLPWPQGVAIPWFAAAPTSGRG